MVMDYAHLTRFVTSALWRAMLLKPPSFLEQTNLSPTFEQGPSFIEIISANVRSGSLVAFLMGEQHFLDLEGGICLRVRPGP